VLRWHTWATDYPTTVWAYNTTANWWYDIVLSRFDPTLTTLMHSTYLWWSTHDYYSYYGGQVVFDDNNDLYLVWSTQSNDFPVTAGSYDTLYQWWREAFILKIDEDLSSVQYSTFIWGTSSEMGSSIEIMDDGNIMFLWATPSAIVPGPTIDAYDSSRTWWDNMLWIFTPDLSSAIQFTYVWGNSSDYNYETDESLILDGECVYFTSSSYSTADTFPVHTGQWEVPYQTNSAGNRDHTVTKMCPASCGDNVVQEFEWEECDDENTITWDGCSATCKIERCGDGLILWAEECDDNNEDSGDGCSSTCEIEYCRDDAPLNDVSKNFVITDLTSWLIAWTSAQANSKVAICLEDTTGSRDIYFTTTDALWTFSYTPNLWPYIAPWVNVWIMLHDENNLDIDHHSLMIMK